MYILTYTYIYIYICIYVGGYMGVIKGSYSVWDLGCRILRGLRLWAQVLGILQVLS